MEAVQRLLAPEEGVSPAQVLVVVMILAVVVLGVLWSLGRVGL